MFPLRRLLRVCATCKRSFDLTETIEAITEQARCANTQMVEAPAFAGDLQGPKIIHHAIHLIGVMPSVTRAAVEIAIMFLPCGRRS